MKTITVNGNTLSTTQAYVQGVLEELALNEGRYAVEINGELVPKSELPTTEVTEHMVIEVVQAVGGG